VRYCHQEESEDGPFATLDLVRIVAAKGTPTHLFMDAQGSASSRSALSLLMHVRDSGLCGFAGDLSGGRLENVLRKMRDGKGLRRRIKFCNAHPDTSTASMPKYTTHRATPSSLTASEMVGIDLESAADLPVTQLLQVHTSKVKAITVG
jgi:hypothetical protein